MRPDATLRVVFPVTIRYVWYKKANEKTQLFFNDGSAIELPGSNVGDIYKLTGFTVTEGIFRNAGTLIVKLSASDLNATRTTQCCLSLVSATDTITCNTNVVFSGRFDVVDIRDALMADLPKSDKVYGLNRSVIILWEFPMPWPGHGREWYLNSRIPGIEAGWPWLEWHGMKCLGLENFDAALESEKWDAVCLAVGAIGYLNGYSHEKIDDTSLPWCKFGQGCDCDDFSHAAASLVTSIISRRDGHFAASPMARFIGEQVLSVECVSGWGRPGGKNKPIPHMWVQLHTISRFAPTLVVETTCPLTHFTEISPKIGRRCNVSIEYLNAEYAWNLQGSRDLVSHQMLPKPELPSWVASLTYDPPAAKLDPHYHTAPVATPFVDCSRIVSFESNAAGVKVFPFMHPIVWHVQ
jgi:hypothetical protein